MKVLPCGDRAVLLDCSSLDEALGWYAVTRELADCTMGARSVLVRGEPARVRELLRALTPVDPAGASDAAPDVEIMVRYDGPDLDEVSQLTGLSPDEVVAAHTAQPWVAAFGGFAPGFAYLVDGDPRLHVPRRDSPRTTVPAGSVGLAGEFSGVYPRSSPGGWQLIGRTDRVLWDVGREPAALLVPGTAVRFVAT